MAYSRLPLNNVIRNLVAFVLLVSAPISFAEGEAKGILVIADLASDIHQTFVDKLKQDDALQGKLKVVDIADYANLLNTDSAGGTRLLLPVGVNAMRAVVNSNPSLPVWAVLVPKRSYATLIEHAQSADRYSAWFIDQPLQRRFELLKLVLPTAERVGVLVGESPDATVQALQDAATNSSLDLIVRRVEDDQDAVTETGKLGDVVDAMLAVPDRISLNLNNAKGILLSAYRQRLPIVGYTNAYVSAGALAAVYSTPEQIAQQVIEELNSFPLIGAIRSDLHYPKYFSVAVNTQVARSLDLQVPSQNSLLKQLQEME